MELKEVRERVESVLDILEINEKPLVYATPKMRAAQEEDQRDAEAFRFVIDTLQKLERGEFVEDGWISVDERPPKEDGIYETVNRAWDGERYVARTRYCKKHGWYVGSEIVTHWAERRPLPQPKGENHDR